MDSGIFPIFQGLPGTINILFVAPRQSCYLGTFDIVSNLPDTLKVAYRCDGETGLDDINIQENELLGQTELLLHVHTGARRLFSIA
jgi:hypothetical protein